MIKLNKKSEDKSAGFSKKTVFFFFFVVMYRRFFTPSACGYNEKMMSNFALKTEEKDFKIKDY